jgi:hypothetical protein
MGLVLVACGVAATAIGLVRGFVAAREALGPLVHEGDPTRTLLEAARPVYARPRVRLFARRVALSVGWLVVALYGVFLASVGLAVGS